MKLLGMDIQLSAALTYRARYKLYQVFTWARRGFSKKNCLKGIPGDIIKAVGSVQKEDLS